MPNEPCVVLPTVMETVVVSVTPVESVTVKVKDTGDALAVVGVPEITPVAVFNDKPTGRVPVVLANV